jgi:group I intron endonuclease
MGIYSITNKINGKRYIGRSENIKRRWRGHKYDLKHNKHRSNHLQYSWNKYGEENFVFEKICEVWDENNLWKIEQTFIDLYKSYDKRFGYNTERYIDEERVVSEETRKKMSIANKGKPGLRGENSPMFGKHLSEEVKEKLRQANLGKHPSEETRNKMSESRKGHISSEETKEKMSLSRRGEKNPAAKLTWKKVDEIREKYETGDYTQYELAKNYDVTRSAIQKIVLNQHWIKTKEINKI